eukprot:4197619-Prymnesium_polylepis.1
MGFGQCSEAHDRHQTDCHELAEGEPDRQQQVVERRKDLAQNHAACAHDQLDVGDHLRQCDGQGRPHAYHPRLKIIELGSPAQDLQQIAHVGVEFQHFEDDEDEKEDEIGRRAAQLCE